MQEGDGPEDQGRLSGGGCKEQYRNAKTLGKVPSRNFSIMKEPEGCDLLVNSLLPRPKKCNSTSVKRCHWEIWTLWVGHYGSFLWAPNGQVASNSRTSADATKDGFKG